MTPAEKVIEQFGGARAVADAISVDPATVYKWTYPKDRGGTEGLVPQRHHAALLKAAELSGLDLEYRHFNPVAA